MPKLQRTNEKNLLSKDVETSNKSQYIYCIKRPNRPRINVLICEQCQYNKKCANYQVFKKALTVEELNISYWKIIPSSKKKVKRMSKKRKLKK